jgi:hypothetical protein
VPAETKGQENTQDLRHDSDQAEPTTNINVILNGRAGKAKTKLDSQFRCQGAASFLGGSPYVGVGGPLATP